MSIFHKDSEEIKFKFLSDSVLKAFEKDGRKYCRLTASSNAEDQHILDFGFWISDWPRHFRFWIFDLRLVERRGVLVSPAIRIPKSAIPNGLMIGSGTKLGASVTVLVRDKSPNPKRSKGINTFSICDFRFAIGRFGALESWVIRNPKSAIPNA